MKADIDFSDMSGLSWQLARGSWQEEQFDKICQLLTASRYLSGCQLFVSR